MTASVANLALEAEVVDAFDLGITAFTTGRAAGNFGLQSDEPASAVMARWAALRARLGGARLATAAQVHGNTILEHEAGWSGWLRADAADGHLALRRGTAMAVTVADCVPVFIAHPSGATAVLHGWRASTPRCRGESISSRSRPSSCARSWWTAPGGTRRPSAAAT